MADSIAVMTRARTFTDFLVCASIVHFLSEVIPLDNNRFIHCPGKTKALPVKIHSRAKVHHKDQDTAAAVPVLYLFLSSGLGFSFWKTSPSVPELHRIGAAVKAAFADYTAGGDLHSAPKQRLKYVYGTVVPQASAAVRGSLKPPGFPPEAF